MGNRKQNTPRAREDDGQADPSGTFSLSYALQPQHWDEMVAGDGTLRPHWKSLARGFVGLGGEEIAARWTRCLRQLRENGVSYTVYGDPRGIDRPWQIDPLPMIIAPEEWRRLEAGLIQRAQLINLVLEDLYAGQTLLAGGLLPPDLVFAHPGYLRPLRHVTPPGRRHLHLCAFDLARDGSGRWWVTADRTDAPSGAGYALENRAVVSRALPEVLREQPVEPLGPFFQSLRDHLKALSPRSGESPRIVLLTPGPGNETYFEHAYLARQLGFTLVEGEDLTVRDGKVALKTLEGLQPVDVILRRTDGSFCDPLELRKDSTLGVAGLVQAVRAGTVAVVNALGSELAEGGALAPFLPALAQHLLGQELMLPSVPTCWCGDKAGRERVLAEMERFIVRSAWPEASASRFGDPLDAEERGKLAAAIQARPGTFIAQERMNLSTVPVWNQGHLAPRPMILRAFVAAQAEGYAVLPGGLVRVAAENDGAIVSMQDGAGSKDGWVLAAPGNATSATSAPISESVRLVRGAQDLPSRVADNLFWLGRYIERAEDTTRLLRSVFARNAAIAASGSAEELPVLLKLLELPLQTRRDIEDGIAALVEAHFISRKGEGLTATVERGHRIAALVRDRLSLDTWRAISGLEREVTRIGASTGDPLPALNAAVLACQALSGLVMENMTRGLGWRFIDIGRRLERGLHVIDLLSGLVNEDEGARSPALAVVLEVLDSVMTYRSRYFAAPQLAPVLDLLLADETNPRALVFQLAVLDDHMAELNRVRRSTVLGQEQRLTIWLSGAVRTAEIEALARPDEDGGRRALETFLEMLRSKLWELSETMTRGYFAHAVGRSDQAHFRIEPSL